MYLNNNFIEAYAKHTDYRVGLDPKGAIGATKDWERHGNLQFEFLKSQGLLPSHHLLDVGCGTGRLARKVIPYLDSAHYYGLDISEGAVKAAYELSVEEGWFNKLPTFGTGLIDRTPRFDYAWAFSVFIHLPDWACHQLMGQVRGMLVPEGMFYFSYVPEKVEVRTGLKQFRHTLEFYQQMCSSAGMSFEPVTSWEGEQRIAKASLL